MHLGKSLMDNAWDAIRNDLNKLPIEGINGNATEQEITSILLKYGISIENNKASVTLWGSSSPMREFLNSDDMADACVNIMENIDFKDLVENRKIEVGEEGVNEIRNTHINIGTGKDITIKDLAYLVKEITNFKGDLIWDTSKPDGKIRKLLNVDKLHRRGWKEKISLKEGITTIYKGYCE